VLLCFMYLHLWLIHTVGNTPRIPSKAFHASVRYKKLYPDYIEKDLITVTIFTLSFIYFICFDPFIFDNPVNNQPGDALITPKHIVPEWYFLPFYLILKLISIKSLGILCMLGVMLLPVFLPFLDKSRF
jgi:ubiquinol-cytochrome c reductase cytochrome b subunit